MLNRSVAVSQLEAGYDVLIIGGGATGLSAALDSATRGYRTLLVTSGDFAQATSSRSTKLIHGGVRYLQQGNIALVREALYERGLLLRNAPHLVKHLRLLIPAYRWWQLPFYGMGLKSYDLLAGRMNLAPSRWVRRQRALEMVRTVRPDGLKGGIVYSDGQFNDARLALALASAAHSHGAVLVNYARVEALLKSNGLMSGAVVVDEETGKAYDVRARTVINSTGIFSDHVRRLDVPAAQPILTYSRGSHIVLDASFLPGEVAILVPRTADGRVVFILPWEARTLVGTTDIPVPVPEMEPTPSEEEIEFLLEHAGMYLQRAPRREDVLSMFAGIRPLVRGKPDSTTRRVETRAYSRDHTLLVSPSGLVTITGGKWTTCRRMAEDAVTQAAQVAGLPPRPCITEHLSLGGTESEDARWQELGATSAQMTDYEARYPGALHERLPYSLAMAAYVVDREMPVHLDDVLSRRLRALLLDACASIEAAPRVAALMAQLQRHDQAWVQREVERYTALARRYLIR
jgi:glycerol-3-phosphate dehydrogenase